MRRAGSDGGTADGLPAIFLQTFGLVGAVEELALEELHSDDGEDEHEEDVDDEDVEDVLQRVDHAVEHGLRRSHTNTPQRVTFACGPDAEDTCGRHSVKILLPAFCFFVFFPNWVFETGC